MRNSKSMIVDPVESCAIPWDSLLQPTLCNSTRQELQKITGYHWVIFLSLIEVVPSRILVIYMKWDTLLADLIFAIEKKFAKFNSPRKKCRKK